MEKSNKVVYVCSPYRADTVEQFNKQLEYTKAVAKEIVLAGHDVIVPHLYYTHFLDDDIEEERKLGISSAINLLKICDLIAVNTKYGISGGMKQEIAQAEIPAIFTEDEKQLSQILKGLK